MQISRLKNPQKHCFSKIQTSKILKNIVFRNFRPRKSSKTSFFKISDLKNLQKHCFSRFQTSKILRNIVVGKGLIEGEYPNIYLSENVSRSTEQLGNYVKNRGMKRQYYKDLVVSFLEKKPEGAKRSEIDQLLFDLIPKSTKNPTSYVGNLLAELKNENLKIIYKDGLWSLIDVK